MERTQLLCSLDPFAGTALPEIRDPDPLDLHVPAVICKYNLNGSLLAVGCRDGRIFVWDSITKNVIRSLIAHLLPITSLGWSPSGKFLYSTSADWSLIIWDVLNATVHKKFYFEGPVLHSHVHPSDDDLYVVSPMATPSVLVNIETDKKTILPSFRETILCSFATFSPSGDAIFMGDSRGGVTILESNSLKIRNSLQTKVPAPIKSIVFDLAGDNMIINSADKTLRIYHNTGSDSWTLISEISDSINRLQWKCACFSKDSEYVLAGRGELQEHNIFFWSKEGLITKTLEGPKEGLMNLCWHPTESILLSISTSGLIFVWQPNSRIFWSAFAPDFVELEENITYTEREDEFDIVSDESEDSCAMEEDSEHNFVDILKESEDEKNSIHYFLPTITEPSMKVPDVYFSIPNVDPKAAIVVIEADTANPEKERNATVRNKAEL